MVALKEIAGVAAAAASPSPPPSPPTSPPPPSLYRHYYMGYYIASCPKMRYKAEYAPSELRCGVSGAWVPAAAAAPRADAAPRAPLLLGFAPAPADPERDRRDALNALVYVQPAGEGGGGGGGDSSGRNGASAGASPDASPTTALLAPPRPPSTGAGKLLRLGQLPDAVGADPASVATLAARLAPWRKAVGDAAERVVVLL